MDIGDQDRRTHKKRVYYGFTTFQQRKLIVDTYRETGKIEKAIEKAKVGWCTFYRWYPRYEERGYTDLKEEKSRAPKNPNTVDPVYAARAIEFKKEHPDWRRRTIAYMIRKEHDWSPVISPSGVRKVLIRAGMWDKVITPKKSSRCSSG
ncbi:MAG: helix-turn-helix domain-containing protein [Candidatus Cloacimonadia bacterium]